MLLSTAAGLKDYPSWRPDGSEIAYQSDQSGNWDIWVTQVKGTRSVNLTGDHPGDDLYPSWSPDGTRIAFWSSREGGGEFVMPALGGRPRKLASTPADPYERRPGPAQWSPVGRWILFSSDRTGDMRLWKVRPVGGEPEPVTGSAVSPAGAQGPLHYQVRWSVDGSSIFFAAKRDGVEGIYVIPADGGPLRQLADFRGKQGRLAQFDTDGQHIYVSWDETKGEIWVMDVIR